MSAKLLSVGKKFVFEICIVFYGTLFHILGESWLEMVLLVKGSHHIPLIQQNSRHFLYKNFKQKKSAYNVESMSADALESLLKSLNNEHVKETESPSEKSIESNATILRK